MLQRQGLNGPEETNITTPGPIDQRDAALVQPRAIGTARVGVRVDAGGMTRLADLRQSGSMKLAFPRAPHPDAEAILINTAGGITGGDRFEVDAEVGAGAALTITTQAAERAYRAQRGEVARVQTKLNIEAGGHLHWLPQELILFDRSALHRRLEIALEEGSRLLMVEPVVFGRAAMREDLREIQFRDRIRITRAGQPLYFDGTDLRGDVTSHLEHPTIGNGAGAMASLVHVNPNAASMLALVRRLLPPSAGTSLLAEDVLVLRQLAPDSFELRRALVPVIELLSNYSLPTSWRL
ncbi:urease accessory protein UreD [Marimonas sp. MJW-29]|uniref:Urease accessory protein UreD n=1 Tax=Sulfitobacter sediminis TaxID=3234186 RepID=A0ABV3RKY9_9RHOB